MKAAAQPMIDWVNSGPPADLAAELRAAFGPDGARAIFKDLIPGAARPHLSLNERALLARLFRGLYDIKRAETWSPKGSLQPMMADIRGHAVVRPCRTGDSNKH